MLDVEVIFLIDSKIQKHLHLTFLQFRRWYFPNVCIRIICLCQLSILQDRNLRIGSSNTIFLFTTIFRNKLRYIYNNGSHSISEIL